METTVKRAYRYRFYPSDEQVKQLSQTFGCVRYVYNRALAERSRAWSEEQKRVSYAETDKMLTGWKRDPETQWLAEPSKGPLQATLRNLESAYVSFWKKRSGYPTFKRKGQGDSATYFAGCFSYRNGEIKLAKQKEPLRIVWSRLLPDGVIPSQVTVSKDASGRYHISILVEETIEHLPPTDTSVGIDAGITSLYTFSTGEKVKNPRHTQRDEKKLRRAQQQLSRKQKGSKNREKARCKVARIHARIADRRRDHLHKLSTRLIHENQVIAIEDLSVRNMVRNRKLSKAISDASWSTFRTMLEYKASWYGRELVVIDRFYPSSKTCSACGHLQAKLPLNIREWECPACGADHDRDVNAAKNILAVGHTVTVCGEGVRPIRV